MTSADPLAAVQDECELVSGVVLGLSEADFHRSTRCPAWSVKQLLGHMFRDVDRLNIALQQPLPQAADTTAVTYWRSYDPVTDGVAIADRAKELAASYPSGKQLGEAWDEMWRRAVEAARSTRRDRVIVSWGPTLTLEEFLKTRVLEITVHGTDLADALSMRPWPTGSGLAITREILVGLLGQEPPPELRWDDGAFLEKGTGRRPLTEDDRARLGELATRFPLLG
jgi:uncharacterized protein (TIGR03083 family)